jgi:hypothetical protein
VNFARLAPQSNSVALSSSPLARRACVGCFEPGPNAGPGQNIFTPFADSPLALAEQSLQCVNSRVPLAVSELGERCRRERDLRERRQAFLNEPFEPAQGRSLVTLRMGLRE